MDEGGFVCERVTENEINGERAARPRSRVVQPPAVRENMTARSVRSLSGALKPAFSNQLARVGAVSEFSNRLCFDISSGLMLLVIFCQNCGEL